MASFAVAVVAMYSASLLERAMDSVLKFGPVQFFCLFWHNRTATGLRNLKKIGNCNRNCAQPVACSCVVGCDWLQSVVHQTSPGPHSTSQNLQVCLQFCTIYWLLIVFHLSTQLHWSNLVTATSVMYTLQPDLRLVVYMWYVLYSNLFALLVLLVY